MLLALTYRWRTLADAEKRKRSRRIFLAWNPPAGVEIVSHYYYADGGGIIILNADGAADLFEALVPFLPTLAYEVHPALNVIEALAISEDVDEWLDSLKDA